MEDDLIDGRINVPTVCKVDEKLGLVFGYAMVCKINGKDHFDLQGDHIPEQTMLNVLTKFMQSGAEAREMHREESVGSFVFAFPMTTDIAKSLGIQVEQTGAIVAMKPKDKGTLKRFVSGELKGFSVFGVNPVYEYVKEQ